MEGVVRDRTLIQLKSTLGQFERFADNCSVHEITPGTVEQAFPLSPRDTEVPGA
jgi:hypothetical protein